MKTNTTTTRGRKKVNQDQDEKTKISCDVPKWLLEKIDEESRKHTNCGRALIIRMALYSYFGITE